MIVKTQLEFKDLLTHIESEIADSYQLMLAEDFIKRNIMEGVSLVKQIEDLPKDHPDYSVYKNVIENLSNDLIRIYNIDKQIFEDILKKTGFSNEQVNALSNGFKFSENKIEELTSLLAKSYGNNIDILQNINSKKIMARINYKEQDENNFSGFVEYILEDVLPAQAMENIAKLSAFQRTKLNSLLETNFKFKELFFKYKDGKELSLSEKRYTRETLEMGIKNMLQKVPVYRTKNNIEYATIEQDLNINIWEKTSGRNRPDAFGIDDNGTLFAYTVTSNINLENQNNQSIEWADRLSNGIKIGLLNIKDFKVVVCSNPILNDFDEKGTKFKEFRKEVTLLEKDKILSKEEVLSLKRLSIDIELLSIFRNVSLDKYENLKNNLEFNVLGESFIVTPKQKETQYKESINNLLLSFRAVNKIIDNNPDMNKISTPIKLIIEGISKGFYNGINNPLNENNSNTDLPELMACFKELKKKLLVAKHDSHKNMNSGLENTSDINETANLLNEIYKENQLVVSNWKNDSKATVKTISKKELYAFKNTIHNCYFDEGLSTQSQLSQIMHFSYNKGNICESLMNDSLSFMADKLKRNNIHKHTLNSMVAGINNALNHELPYDLTKAFKKIIRYKIDTFIVNALKGKNKDFVSNEIDKLKNKRKIKNNI